MISSKDRPTSLALSVVDGDPERSRRNTTNLVKAFLVCLWSNLGETRRFAHYPYPHSRHRHALRIGHIALYPSRLLSLDGVEVTPPDGWEHATAKAATASATTKANLSCLFIMGFSFKSFVTGVARLPID